MSQYRFGLLLLSLAVFPVLVAGQAGQSPTGNPRYKLHGEKAPKKEGPERPVQGVVRAPDDSPVEGAVVHLVDLETKGMRSFITKKDGTFLFEGLNKDTDYELFAEFNDLESRKRRLSSLDPADKLVRNLTLEPKAKEEKKESASRAKKKS